MGPWQLLAAAFAAQAAISFVELGVPILAPFIKDGLGLSAFALGVLVGSLNVGRFAGSVPAGQLADRLGERLVLIASGLGLCLFAILAAAATYWPMLLALVFAGVFSGAATPAGSRVVWPPSRASRADCRWGSARQRSHSAASPRPSRSLLASAWGWRWTSRPRRSSPSRTAVIAAARCRRVGSAAGSRSHLALIARTPKIAYAGIWALVFVGGQYALLTYLALYLEDDLGVDRTEAFAAVALANLSGVAGRLAWGWLSDRAFGSRRRPGLVLLSLLGILSTALLAGAPPGDALPVVMVAAALGGFCLIGWQGLWVTMVSELAPEGSSGTAVGFALLFTNAGIVLWPPLLGLTADVTGSFRWSWALLGAALVAALWPLRQIRFAADVRLPPAG